MKKGFIIIVLLLGAAAAGAWFYFNVWNPSPASGPGTTADGGGGPSAGTGEDTSSGDSNTPKIPPNNTKIAIVRKNYSVKGRFDFRIDIPSVTLTGNESLEKLVKSEIISDYDKVRESIENSYDESSEIDDEAGASGQIYSAVATVKSKYSSAKTISIAMGTETYGGGAHGYESLKSYNYAVYSGKRLTLRQILGDSKTKLALVNSRIRKHLDDEGIEVFEGARTDITSGYEGFYVDEKMLTVFFNPYDIASYAAGFISVKIPLSDIGWTPY